MELKFGKHKGKKLSEVPMDYLMWLSSETDTNDPKYGDANKKLVQAVNDEMASRSGAVKAEKTTNMDPQILASFSKLLNTIHQDLKEIKEAILKKAEDVPF